MWELERNDANKSKQSIKIPSSASVQAKHQGGIQTADEELSTKLIAANIQKIFSGLKESDNQNQLQKVQTELQNLVLTWKKVQEKLDECQFGLHNLQKKHQQDQQLLLNYIQENSDLKQMVDTLEAKAKQQQDHLDRSQSQLQYAIDHASSISLKENEGLQQISKYVKALDNAEVEKKHLLQSNETLQRELQRQSMMLATASVQASQQLKLRQQLLTGIEESKSQVQRLVNQNNELLHRLEETEYMREFNWMNGEYIAEVSNDGSQKRLSKDSEIRELSQLEMSDRYRLSDGAVSDRSKEYEYQLEVIQKSNDKRIGRNSNLPPAKGQQSARKMVEKGPKIKSENQTSSGEKVSLSEIHLGIDLSGLQLNFKQKALSTKRINIPKNKIGFQKPRPTKSSVQEQELIKKIASKDEEISQLQRELQHSKREFIKKSEAFELEGDYEMRLDDLQQNLEIKKLEFDRIVSAYLDEKSYSQALEKQIESLDERLQEWQLQFQKQEVEYKQYQTELKQKCLDEIEEQMKEACDTLLQMNCKIQELSEENNQLQTQLESQFSTSFTNGSTQCGSTLLSCQLSLCSSVCVYEYRAAGHESRFDASSEMQKTHRKDLSLTRCIDISEEPCSLTAILNKSTRFRIEPIFRLAIEHGKRFCSLSVQTNPKPRVHSIAAQSSLQTTQSTSSQTLSQKQKPRSLQLMTFLQIAPRKCPVLAIHRTLSFSQSKFKLFLSLCSQFSVSFIPIYNPFEHLGGDLQLKKLCRLQDERKTIQEWMMAASKTKDQTPSNARFQSDQQAQNISELNISKQLNLSFSELVVNEHEQKELPNDWQGSRQLNIEPLNFLQLEPIEFKLRDIDMPAHEQASIDDPIESVHWSQHADEYLPDRQQLLELDGQEQQKLACYLESNRLKTSLVSITSRDNFVRPTEIVASLYVLITRDSATSVREVFVISKVEIYSLTTETSLRFKGQYEVTTWNFTFGQAEVLIRANADLKINRKDKMGRLKGDQPDGLWRVDSYYHFRYALQ